MQTSHPYSHFVLCFRPSSSILDRCVYQPQNTVTPSSKWKDRLWRKQNNISCVYIILSNIFVNYALGLWMSVWQRHTRTHIYQNVKAIIDVPFCDWAPSCLSEVAFRLQSTSLKRSWQIQLKEEMQYISMDSLDFSTDSTDTRSNMWVKSKFVIVLFRRHWINVPHLVKVDNDLQNYNFISRAIPYGKWFNKIRNTGLP
jgi:hypothetical protein